MKARGQPEITINKIADKVELMCGLERKSRTDPKAFARNPTDEDKANAATQGLRYISDDNNFPLIRSDVYESLMVEGAGGADLALEDDGRGGANITITQVPFDRLFSGPALAAWTLAMRATKASSSGWIAIRQRRNVARRGRPDIRYVRDTDRQLRRPAARYRLVRQQA